MFRSKQGAWARMLGAKRAPAVSKAIVRSMYELRRARAVRGHFPPLRLTRAAVGAQGRDELLANTSPSSRTADGIGDSVARSRCAARRRRARRVRALTRLRSA